jgi:hypothetical protein
MQTLLVRAHSCCKRLRMSAVYADRPVKDADGNIIGTSNYPDHLSVGHGLPGPFTTRLFSRRKIS